MTVEEGRHLSIPSNIVQSPAIARGGKLVDLGWRIGRLESALPP